MKLIKHINNNFAVAEDSVGNIVIVQGKGIGYGALPRELKSFEGVVRTYYNIDENYFDMINEIPTEVITLAGEVVDKAVNDLNCELSANIVFTLADHINFSIERYKKKISMSSPIVNDVKLFYEKEYEIGLYALALIKKQLNETLPKDEAAYIALHIINSKQSVTEKEVDSETVLSDITGIIERKYSLKLNTDSFNYSRFVSHINFFLKRIKCRQIIQTNNEKIYESVKHEYVEAYECVEEIAEYFRKTFHISISDEEKLYLMLHVNKLCSREACNQ